MSLITIICAILGLSFLVFIHELGHYIVALRTGMTVEVFSIGFGPAILKWDRKGIRWQVSAIPFGGYVKIKGMEKEKGKEPYEIKGGFFAKKPLDRIKVALAGPIVNIAFAFLVFCLIFAMGGRVKPFSETTKIVGWVNPESPLSKAGLEAGDEIEMVGDKAYHSYRDLIVGALLNGETLDVSGEDINYYEGKSSPFAYSVPKEGDEEAAFTMLSPASYLIASGQTEKLESSPALQAGLKQGDRIVWAEGELIFSVRQLSELINSPVAMLTIQRGDQTFLLRVPRVLVRDIRMSDWELGDIDDWQHEVGLQGDPKLRTFIPYQLDRTGTVQAFYAYLDDEFSEHVPRAEGSFPFEADIELYDRVIAVDGFPVSNVYEIFDRLQTRHINVIVESLGDVKPLPYKEADRDFVERIDGADVFAMAESIGLNDPYSVGNLTRLAPIEPVRFGDFPEQAKFLDDQIIEINKINDATKRKAALREVDLWKNRLVLGAKFSDRKVAYNPGPFTLFVSVFKETYSTLLALFTGLLSPKYVSGPVGIVQVMQTSLSVSLKEALFWLGAISLNLGLLNLLPIPVLDGGHICFSLLEMVRKKPLKAKTMEKLIIPFVVLLLVFFVFVTFNDIVRLIP